MLDEPQFDSVTKELDNQLNSKSAEWLQTTLENSISTSVIETLIQIKYKNIPKPVNFIAFFDSNQIQDSNDNDALKDDNDVLKELFLKYCNLDLIPIRVFSGFLQRFNSHYAND